jgi:hypothetical protein
MARTPQRHPMAARGGQLSLEVLDFLLACSRSIASVDRLHAAGREYDPFFEFTLDMMPIVDFLHLWKQHKDAIAREAARRGIALPDPSTYQPFPRACWVVRQWDGE